MTTNILVTFYSTYGHVHRMALAVAEGAESVHGTTVRLCRIAELEEARKALSAQDAYLRAQQAQADIPAVTHDDLRWADSPYGPGTLAGTDGSRQPVEAELTTARNLGSRLARVAGCLKDLRASRAPAP
jgi:multimeric flavodoxin WrbA